MPAHTNPMVLANPRRAFGQLGERLALHHLQANGYRIRETNYRCAEGEIDIIAEHGGTIVFVEVKARRGSRMGTATDAVTPAKQRRLIALAEAYAAEHAPDAGLRIDVIAIDFAPAGRLLSLNHYENAVIGA
jgi:putative endonuclease